MNKKVQTALGLLILLFAAYGFLSMLESSIKGNITRSCMPWSHLSCGDSRIIGVAQEFKRRSERLNQNFDQFEICFRRGQSLCQDILEQRDIIVTDIWPEIAERILVERDWYFGPSNRREYENLLWRRNRYSSFEKFVEQCKPLIRYREVNKTYLDIRYEGLLCTAES